MPKHLVHVGLRLSVIFLATSSISCGAFTRESASGEAPTSGQGTVRLKTTGAVPINGRFPAVCASSEREGKQTISFTALPAADAPYTVFFVSNSTKRVEGRQDATATVVLLVRDGPRFAANGDGMSITFKRGFREAVIVGTLTPEDSPRRTDIDATFQCD